MEGNRIGRGRAVPPEGDAFGIMLQLREADKMLDPTDAVTVSHAPADGHSKFFTADGTMLGNREMIWLEKRLTPT